VRTGFVTDPLFDRHDTGPGHPERAARLPAIRAAVADLPLLELEPRDAARAELEAAHDPAYLDALKERIAEGATQLDADTAVSTASFSAAVRAAGAALALAEALLEDRIDSGFACVRPPGHHACHARAMGFCLVNNAAVLARFLQSRGKRVAIVDWDVHHGNGTQDIFWREPEVGYCSLHEYPFYPGTGGADESGAGNILNIPLRAGCGDTEYQAAFQDKALPWLDERAPDIVIVSAGFDAHAADPLAGMDLSAESFAALTRKLLDWPILSLLEGGYNLDGLATSVRAHLQVLVDA